MAYYSRNMNRLPNIRGGRAIPIGNDFYYMKGRSHEQGGIDVGKDLEVEKDEIMQLTPKSIRVYSAQPILNGISPAQALLCGANPNKVFKAQEDFKDRFNLNDDGTFRAKFGGRRKAALGIDWNRYNSDAQYRSQVLQQMSAEQNNRPKTKVTKEQLNSPIFADNDARIAASEQGRMDRVNKQIADNERIKNSIVNTGKDVGKFIIENAPITGDVIALYDIAKELYKGEYGNAMLAAAPLIVPKALGDITKKSISWIRDIPFDKVTREALEHLKLQRAYKSSEKRTNTFKEKFFDEYLENKFPGINEKADKNFALYDTMYSNPETDSYYDAIRELYSDKDYKGLAEHVKQKINYRYNQQYEFLKNNASAKNIDLDKYINDIADTNLKQILKDNPDYAYYSAISGKNPADKTTINDFIKRQSTSKRGVTAKNDERATEALSAVYGNRLLARANKRGTGGDRLNTNGGLYTSNSNELANRFSSGGNSYEAILYHDYGIDPNASIKDQLYQFKSRNINRDLTDAKVKDLAKQDVRSIESLYQMRNGKNIPIYERAYITDKDFDRNMMNILELKHNGLLKDTHGRWGDDAKISDDLFIPSVTSPNLSSIIKYTRFNKDKAPYKNTKFYIDKREELTEYLNKYYDIRNSLYDKQYNLQQNILKLKKSNGYENTNKYLDESPIYFDGSNLRLTDYKKPKQFDINDYELPFRLGGEMKNKKAIGGSIKRDSFTGQGNVSKTSAKFGTKVKAELGVEQRGKTTPKFKFPQRNTAVINGILSNADRENTIGPLLDRKELNLNTDNQFSTIEFPVADFSRTGDIPWLNRIRTANDEVKQTPITLNIAYPKEKNTIEDVEYVEEVPDVPNIEASARPISTARKETEPFAFTNTKSANTTVAPTTTNKLARTRITPKSTEVTDYYSHSPFYIDKGNIFANDIKERKLNINTNTPAKLNTSNVPNLSKTKSNIFSTIGNYFKNNLEEVVSIGSNGLGSILGWLNNNIAINRMKAPSAPTPKPAIRLKKNININPRLDQMRETAKAYERNIRQSTSSNAVANNRINRTNFASASEINKLYADKENKETELINRDRLNQQAVAHANVDAYNQYQDRLSEFRNKKADLRSENNQGLIAGLNTTIQNVITNRQKDRQFRNTNMAMLTANPNLPAEALLANNLITEDMYKQYRKLYPNKTKNS